MTQEFAFSQADADHTFTYTNFQGQEVTLTRTVTGTIFAPDAPGTYPVVFYSHGHFGSPTGGAAVNARALAEQGYIVIAPRHLDSLDFPPAIRSAFPLDEPASTLHRIADIRFLFDILPDLMDGAPGYAADASRAAIAGHSHGAFTAALLIGAQSFKPGLDEVAPGNEFGLSEIADDRFAEAILLSPQGALGAGTTFGFTESSWDGVTVPVLTLTGSEDNGTDDMTYRDRLDGFEHGPPGGKHAFVLAGADHGQLGGGDISDPAINAEVAAIMTAFLDAYAKGDAAALALLADVAAFADAHPLLIEAYERSEVGANGSGVLRGDGGDDDLEGLSTDDTISGGGGNDTLDGGRGADRLNGNAGEDRLVGGGGIDTLHGGDGDDRLAGGGGGDTLRGGLGRDVMSGDAGADRFDFNATGESGLTAATRDRIADFAAGGGATTVDRIDVMTIDADAGLAGNQAFIFGGAFTAGHIRAVQSGANVRLRFNTDSDAAAEMEILLDNVLAGDLNSGDFVL